jgi:DNA-binding beta-propeller fold protein YncE
MKHLLFFFLLLPFSKNTTAQHSVNKMWTTDTTLASPESVLYHEKEKALFVSLIDGESNAKDGKGGVAKVDLDGKIINANWITGLNAPKGIGVHGNNLYVADVDEVVVIDIAKNAVAKKITVEGSVFLNDVTVDKKGIVYVSDSRTGKIHKLENEKASTFLENVQGPNGLLAVDNDLYILASGSLLKADATGKNLQTLAEDMDNSTDGIEQVQPGEFIVSCWTGIAYYVKADGTKEQLFDTREEKINSADIGYDAKNRIVYVPTFFKNSVVAYQLK